MNNFQNALENSKRLFDSFFLEKITSILDSYPESKVSKASLYSLKAGGKRIRPLMVVNSFYANARMPTLFSNQNDLSNVLLIASAVECIHTYSLIHDDLPDMDNDDMRRGSPTCHRKFDIPTAILAGDALNSFSFYLLSRLNVDAGNLKACLDYLHRGAGFPGMIAGQMEDLEEEGKSIFSDHRLKLSHEERLFSIHEKKTGALIVASFLLGNRLRSDFAEREKTIILYAKEIGILFQITDDILDVEGSKESLGKTPGKDAVSGKLTFPALFGMEKSKLMCAESRDNAIAYAKELDENNESFFLGLPTYLAERKN